MLSAVEVEDTFGGRVMTSKLKQTIQTKKTSKQIFNVQKLFVLPVLRTYSSLLEFINQKKGTFK